MDSRERQALRLLAEAILVLTEEPTAEAAPEQQTRPPTPTRDRLARVRPTDMDKQRARAVVTRLGLVDEGESK